MEKELRKHRIALMLVEGLIISLLIIILWLAGGM